MTFAELCIRKASSSFYLSWKWDFCDGIFKGGTSMAQYKSTRKAIHVVIIFVRMELIMSFTERSATAKPFSLIKLGKCEII